MLFRLVVALCALLVVVTGQSEAEIDNEIVQKSKTENRFVSMGCWGGEKNSKQRQKEVADLMKKLVAKYDISYAIAAGDNFYRKGIGSVSDQRWDDGWANLYPEIPFLAALGNHDYRGNIWAQVNKTFEPSNQLRPNTPRWTLPHPYYDIVMGGVHWFIIDTVLLERCEVNPRGTKLWHDRCWDKYHQLDWLSEKLQTSTAKWKIVVGHYPMYANGPHVNHPWLRRILCPLFESNGVSMYINADNHYMQYSIHNNIHYVNAGGGAGYMKHTAKDKGFKMDDSNVWHHFGDGLFTHFISDDVMTVYAISPSGSLLTKFEVHPRKSEVQLTTTHKPHPDKTLEQKEEVLTIEIAHRPITNPPIDAKNPQIFLSFLVLVIAVAFTVKKLRFRMYKQHAS